MIIIKDFHWLRLIKNLGEIITSFKGTDKPMKYSYNKNFFGDWMRKHKYMIKDVIRVLNTSSYQSANRWMAGATLPVEAIIKLCNNYPDLKISDFIIGYQEKKELPLPQSSTWFSKEDIDAIKADYEKRLESQRDLMQNAIDMQREIIETQKLLIQQLRAGEQSAPNLWQVADGGDNDNNNK